MSGRIWLDSEVGVGTTFHVVVPMQRAAERVRRTSVDASRALEGRHVLVVDDNETNLRILRSQLSAWGMDVATFQDPAAALASVEAGQDYDLAVLDVQMPGMDGVTLAHRIRATAAGARLRLLMLTSLGRTEPGLSDLDGTAELSKPVKSAQLHATLARLLRESPAVENPSTPVPRRVPASRLHILVADDNPVNRQVAARILERLGYVPDIVTDGREAVEAVTRQPYDVVLMDVYMPGMDGLEASTRIRQTLPDDRQPVIVALTAGAFAEERERCRAAGMDDFLTKPVRAEVLEDVLRDIETRAGRPQRAPDGASAGEAETVPADTFDRRVLDELREALGDTDGAFVRELVDAFTAQAPGLVEQIEQAIAAGDREALRFSAHTLKGSSGSVGAVRLAALSDRLEHQDEGLSDLPPVVASVHVELRAVVETLQNYVDGR